MSEIRILELSLRNFKGIKGKKISSPEGKNLYIYGGNGTGKTTIMDAFIWLLFDKDSQNSSNFNIKTLGPDGKVIHGLEHEVSAILAIDGKKVELKKIYKEKWTKKRGQATAELTGHTTDYYINNVPKKLNEYKNYLSQIIDENTFRILTNPLYFNRVLDWKKRREIALNICGEASKEEIISKDKKLSALEKLLEDKTIDDLKAEMVARRRKLNEELKSIPYRIDELSRELNVEIDIAGLTAEKKEFEAKLSELKSSKDIDYDFRLRSIVGSMKVLENKLECLKQDSTKNLREMLGKTMEEGSKLKKDYYQAKEEVEENIQRVEKFKKTVTELNQKVEELRDTFNKIIATKFDQNSTICPTCKQTLPAQDIERLVQEFEKDKQEKLSLINENGKNAKKELTESKEELEGLQSLQEPKEEAAKSLYDEMTSKANEVKDIEDKIANADITNSSEYKEIQEKLEKLKTEKEEIENLEKQQDNSIQTKALEDKIAEINKQLARIDLAKDNQKRIDELKTRERELANMVAETEKLEFLCEKYIITKAELLEDKLNNKFKLVKFKLFDVQVNGGINETFVTTVNGVPFEDLNNAMRINAGLDIINTLTDYYDFKAPIFIDNRESVNKIIKVKSQVINLIVNSGEKLELEVEDNDK